MSSEQESFLVSVDWVQDHLYDPNVRIIESNEDQLLYHSGHIPSAVEIDWIRDLNDPVRRDYLNRENFSELMSRLGITREMTCVFYGDKSNWWACYTFWVFKLFGHEQAKIMDGGRLKWELEKRPFTSEVPKYKPSSYAAPARDDNSDRLFRDGVLAHLKAGGLLVDVRSRDEFTGKRLHMEGYPNEGALRGGHIPGAKHIPWQSAINLDQGTFKTLEELRAIYVEQAGLNPNSEVVAYCRIGERSSVTWFVLKYLLGFKHVRNYDGSWTEWGNLVGVPIETGGT